MRAKRDRGLHVLAIYCVPIPIISPSPALPFPETASPYRRYRHHEGVQHPLALSARCCSLAGYVRSRKQRRHPDYEEL